ncbi:hypothetical protein NUW58_g10785 [Xylaria curta]|uniref:Uncharacterized protein n=1 Tax=Xylaria curta TaxID=42375 RepID=A0ACC1MGA8_9PEZI|nr:hypothetical protein NUW58_g10785 [Xylaria curta]
MITFHPWSWADELTLSAAWNESFYNKEIVVDALQKIMEELGDGLKMEKVSYRIVSSKLHLRSDVLLIPYGLLRHLNRSIERTPEKKYALPSVMLGIAIFYSRNFTAWCGEEPDFCHQLR